MRVLLDTNIILDHALGRSDFCDSADRVLQVCARSSNDVLVTFHTITNAYYVMNRTLEHRVVRKFLTDLCAWVELAPTSLGQIQEGLKLPGDLEDDLQWICARDGNADVIVTRDVKGFKNSSIVVMEPAEFLFNFE